MPARIRFPLLFSIVAAVSIAALAVQDPAAVRQCIVRMPIAVLLSLPVAICAWRVGIVSRSGAIAGSIAAGTLMAGAGWPAWLYLGGAMAITSGVTRAGRDRKLAMRIAQEQDGRRAWRNVAANVGVAALAAPFATVPALATSTTLLVAATLATATADSTASEIGKAWGGQPRLMFPSRVTAPGTPGGLTFVGTAAGAGIALIMAAGARCIGLIRGTDLTVVALAAFTASVSEAALARALEVTGWLDNDGVNFLSTGLGGLLALLLARSHA